MLIKNAVVVTETDCAVRDVYIEQGLIAEIGNGLSPRDGETVDAAGNYLLPGGIDVHTHFELELPSCRSAAGFYEGTVAAACGGTTTVIEHPSFGPRSCGLLHQIEAYHKLADGNAVIDYGFHAVAQHVNGDVLNDMQELVSQGVTSMKIYTTYEYKLGQQAILPILKRAREHGILVTVHAEDDNILAELRNRYPITPSSLPRARPEKAESEAINTLLRICRALDDAPIYIVHLSSARGLEVISEARVKGQKNIYAETCPQYLLLDSSRYDQVDALKYIMTPPLRERRNNTALWEALIDGSIQTIATDHCAFNYAAEKQLGAEDYRLCPGGAPGVECRMPLMFGKGVLTGRLTPNRFVELTATAPAKLFGLYPRKGVIAVGSDADLVLMGQGDVTITGEMLHEHVDYTPYEGMRPKAWPVMTISRGEVVAVSDGLGSMRFVGEKGRGKFLKRSAIV